MRIIAVHLLNDYSGSPKVLKQLLQSWTKNNIETHLFTGGGREGFLSSITDVQHHFYWYRFAKYSIIRLLFYTLSQFVLAFKLLFFLRKNDIVYINTVLPFGAAIAAKIRACKVLYHIHETSVKPLLLKQFLFGIVKWSATEVVYVSNFLARQEIMNQPKHILYNVLDNNFIDEAKKHLYDFKEQPIVLMICSLKAYKGVNEFVQLGRMNPQYIFKLVVNANEREINSYFRNEILPTNFTVYPTQKNTHSFYAEASIVLNLSDVHLWVETFGLTILEAMSYGLPTIVPPIGGITELVADSENGFLIDSKDLDLISLKIRCLFNDRYLYQMMSKAAYEKSKCFDATYFEKASLQIVTTKE